MKIYWTDKTHYICKEFTSKPPESTSYIFKGLKVSNLSLKTFKSLPYYFRNRIKGINIEIPLSNSSYAYTHTYGSLYPLKDWVSSFEDATAFTYLERPNQRQKEIVKSYLNQCDYLLPLSRASKTSLMNLYGNTLDFDQKVEVVYPSFEPPEEYNTESETTNLLFVAREFERKGGYEAFQAFKKLDNEYDDLNFICVSDTPREIVREAPENTEFFEDVERDKLLDLYRRADLFIYPTFHDTFGFVMVEAMGFGCPVITLEDYATREIVDDGEDGFVVEGYETKWYDDDKIRINKYNNWKKLRKEHEDEEKERIVQDIVKKTSPLIENDEKRKEFSERARDKVEKGKFSTEGKNRKLNRIYEEVNR